MVSHDSDDNQDDGKAKLPPTPLESLRNQYRNRPADNATVSTSSNSLSGKSRQSMLSTSSARFIELEARITRQQSEFDRKEKISSDRLSQIERQLHRFDEVESKIDSLKNDIDSKIDESQQAQRADLQTMNGQILVVMENQDGFGASINILSDKISLLMGLMATNHSSTNEQSMKIRRPSPYVSPCAPTNANVQIAGGEIARETFIALMPNESEEKRNEDKASHEDASKSSSSTESGKFRSPDKKKQRPVIQPTGQNQELDSEHLEDMNIEEADPNNTMVASAGHDDSPTTRSLEDITTDLESRYNTQNSLGGGSPV